MPVPVLTISQMREWENAAWSSGLKEADVIRAVGARVAAEALRMTHLHDAILVLAGIGNNGADARAVLPELKNRKTQLIDVVDPAKQLPQVQHALAAKPALIVDGLFGVGLNRPLSHDWVSLVRAVNQANRKVLSIDVPSGLNADSGLAEGAAIKATATLAVGAPKRGMLTPAAGPLVGRLVVARQVGLGACPIQSELNWVLPEDFHEFPPERTVASHKGTYGHLAIIAGSAGFHGAATLCARGAQRAQPGLITLFTMESVYPIVASQAQAVMVSPWNLEAFHARQWSAIVVGPGLAGHDVPSTLRECVQELWRDWNLPMLVDASALAWLKPEPVNPAFLRVITPHPGEAGRMLRTSTDEIQTDRFKAVRNLSAHFGDAWVVLKGHHTLLGHHSSGSVYVNPSGNPYLAQGGSGDLLAGFIGGLLAQPPLRISPSRTIAYAVWQHGAAADRLSNRKKNWIIEDLAETLGR